MGKYNVHDVHYTLHLSIQTNLRNGTICSSTTITLILKTITVKVSTSRFIFPNYVTIVTDPCNVTAEPYRLDDIRTEYHPHSALRTKVEHFEDYKRHQRGQPSVPCDKEPWSPFRSRIDFEFAEIALKAALNKDLANSLIKLVHRSIAEQGTFTLESHADMQDMWDKASAKLTTVSFCSLIHVTHLCSV